MSSVFVYPRSGNKGRWEMKEETMIRGKPRFREEGPQ